MSYNYKGQKLPSGGGESFGGYTMQNEPEWTSGVGISALSGQSGFGTAEAAASVKASGIIPIMGRNVLQITMPVADSTDPVKWGLVFYDDSGNPLRRYSTPALYNRGSSARAQVVEIFVPPTATSFRTTYWSDATRQTYSDIPAFTYTFTPGLAAAEQVTHELPANRGVLNMIRRARQMTDIVWTPLVNIPRFMLADGSGINFLDWFRAGQTYKGIPYSGSGEPDMNDGQINPNYLAGKWGYEKLWVGLETDLETFISAARYPGSILGSRTGYTTPQFDSSPYGLVCNAFVWWATGHSGHVPLLATQIINAISCDTVSANPMTMYVDTLQLGDILWSSPHIAIITDFLRDASGNIIGIEISESTTVGNPSPGAVGDKQTTLGGVCRRKMWSVEDWRVKWQTYTIYRPRCLTGVTYTRSRYVDTGGEGDFRNSDDLPCIPYLGNKARYKVGYILNSKVLIGASGFQTLVVTKDGEEFGRFTINGATEVSVGFSEAGAYTAYMLDSGSHRTKACEWTVE